MTSTTTTTTTPASTTINQNTTSAATTTPTTIGDVTIESTTLPLKPDDDDFPLAPIVGGVVGGVVLIIIVVIVIIVWRRRRSSEDDEDDDDNDDDDDDSTPPPMLPKLDERGQVIPSAGSAPSSPAPQTPGVYEDPSQQPTQLTFPLDKENHYGNVPPRFNESSGSYIVPMDRRPVESPPISPQREPVLAPRFPDKAEKGGQGESATVYMAMDLRNPSNPQAEKPRNGADQPRAKPSPCTAKKSAHGYVNVPSDRTASPGDAGAVHSRGTEETEPFYGNVGDLAAVANGANGSASQASENNARKNHMPAQVSPRPSPKPSPKGEKGALSATKASTPVLLHASPRPSPMSPPKSSPRSPPKSSPKPSPKPVTRLAVFPLARQDTEESDEGENYENLGDHGNYVNAPEKRGNYVNAPPKKTSK